MNRPHTRTFAVGLIVAVAYALTTYGGLRIAFADGVVAPVWVPAGIAVAALSLGGRRLWPAVLVGGIVGNLASGSPIGLAVSVSVVNAACAVLGAWLVARVDVSPRLDRVRDIAHLVWIALVTSAAAATGGVIALGAAGFVNVVGYPERWLLWFSGDVTGILITTTFIFTVAAALPRAASVPVGRAVEFAVVHAGLVAISWMVFISPGAGYPALMFPFLAYTAVRFRALGATTSALLITALGIYAAYHAAPALINDRNLPQAVQILQTMTSLVGVCALLIAATLTQADVLRASAEESARRLRAIDDAKDRLLAAVSHELRTPLTSILGLSQLLNLGAGTIERDKLREMTGRLELESTRLDSLLNDLLDLERLRLGMLDASFEQVDVAEVVRGSVHRAAPAERQVKLDLQEDVCVDADPTKLERIVDNLVANADRHTRQDGRIFVSLRGRDDGALLAVDDEGLGVPDHHKLSIFAPFDRGLTDPSETPGTGIGLSLVQQFTELHGGRAWVEDRDGGGASFRVFIPRTRA